MNRGFVSWRNIKESPLDSSLVSAVGGLIILLVGIIGLHILFSGGIHFGPGLVEEIAGTVWGILILIFSALLFLDRPHHALYGAGIIIVSAASWYGTSGGLFVGFLIAFIGGIMGITWKPPRNRSSGNARVQ